MGDSITLADGRVWHLNMWWFPTLLEMAAEELEEAHPGLSEWLIKQSKEGNGLRWFDVRGFNDESRRLVEDALVEATRKIGRKQLAENKRKSAAYFFLFRRYVEAARTGASPHEYNGLRDGKLKTELSPAFQTWKMPPVETLDLSEGIRVKRQPATRSGRLIGSYDESAGRIILASPDALPTVNRLLVGKEIVIELDSSNRITRVDISIPREEWEPATWEQSFWCDAWQEFTPADLIVHPSMITEECFNSWPVSVVYRKRDEYLCVRVIMEKPPVVTDKVLMSGNCVALVEPKNVKGFVIRLPRQGAEGDAAD